MSKMEIMFKFTFGSAFAAAWILFLVRSGEIKDWRDALVQLAFFAAGYALSFILWGEMES